MKTILIATDFSDAANNAAAYGIELAYTFNATVILFSACEPLPVPVSEVPVIITMKETELHVQRQLANDARMLSARHNTPVVPLSKTGAPAKTILEAVRENQVEMVITGMKGSGKQIRRIVGSTVTELIRRIQVPVIVVPEEATFAYLATIALANESDMAPDEDPHELDALREIVERFHSKLYLVRVATNRFAEAFEVLNQPFQLNRLMRTLDPEYECIEGKDITGALVQFVDKYSVNLLALLPHKHSLFERWFTKSITKAVTFEAPIPLLILPGKHK